MKIDDLLIDEAQQISKFQNEYLNLLKQEILKSGLKLNPEKRREILDKLIPIVKKNVIYNLKLGVKWLNEGEEEVNSNE